jgi:hypothetical protein
MRTPQFTLFSALVALTVCAALTAWLATGSSQQIHPPGTVAYTVAVPRASGLITTTIAVAFGMVGLTWAILLSESKNPSVLTAARVAWTLGYLSYLAHVAAAFETFHHWSHAEAAFHTGFRTWELTGWFWTGGIWVNYAFTLVWAADVIYWWSGLDRYARRPPRLRWFVHAFFAFMIFQAGVVFAVGPIRWLTLAGLLTVAFLGLVRLAHTPQQELPRV